MKHSVRKTKLSFVLMAFILVLMGSAICTAHASTEGVNLSFEEGYAKPGTTLHLVCENTDLSKYDLVWYVNDNMLNTHGTTYSVKDKDIEKIIKVQAYDGNEVVGETMMLCSELPVVYINTEDNQSVTSKEDYINAQVSIQGNDEYQPETTTLYTGPTEIKGHGNSTWKWFPKKAYHLKLDKSTSLFDMGKNKHWLLIANYIDESCMRNQTSGQIAKTLGAEYLDSLWVDVVFNGEHQGNYQLYEQARIGESRVNITDWEDEGESAAKKIAKDIAKKQAKDQGMDETAAAALEDQIKGELKTQMTEKDMSWMSTGVVNYGGKEYKVADYYTLPESRDGGYLYEIDFTMDEASTFYTNRGVPVMFKKPEFICTDPATMDVAKGIVQTFEDALYATDHNANGQSYTDLCDVDTAVPFWLTSEIMFNEAGKKSTYFYKGIGEKIHFGPVWDFDWSSNNVAPFADESPKGWYLTSRWWLADMARDPYFAIKAKELYLDHYDELMDLIEGEDYLSQWHSYISSSAAKNESLWPYSRGFEDDYQMLRAWIKERTDWINSQFSSDDKAVTSLGSTLSNNLQLGLSGDCYAGGSSKNFYAVDGNLMLQGSVNGNFSKANIYVNSKYVGSADITADANGNTFQYELDTSTFTEAKGMKNVITVWLTDSNGALCEMQYLSVTVCDVSAKLCKVIFNDYGNMETVYTIPAGKKIIVPDSMQAHTVKEFAGWVNESNAEQVLQAGKTFAATDDCQFKASFKPCKDSDDHSWVKFDDGFQCQLCGITKGDDGVYTDIQSCIISQSSRYGTKYSGKEAGPKITVKYNDVTLTEGVEYTITYKNNIDAGFATYYIKGVKEAGFDGVAELTYRIVSRDVANSSVKISLDKDGYVYTGKEIKPVVTLKLFGNTFEEGKDYTVAYRDNVNMGTGTVIITGHGNFTGTVEKTFDIGLKKVEGVKAESAGLNAIKLSWKAQSGVTGYKIYRATTKNGTYSVVKTITDPATSAYTNTGRTTGTTYYYKIKAYKTVDGVNYFSVGSDGVVSAKPMPKNVTFTAKSASYKSVKLSWNKQSGITGYKIYRATAKNGTYKLIKTIKDPAKTTFTNSNLKTGKAYYYKVKAYKTVDGKNCIGNGSYKKVTPMLGKATVLPLKSMAKSSVTVKWNKVSGANGYKIYRSASKTGTYTCVKTVSSKSVSYTNKTSKLKAGKTYYYKVKAYRLVDGKKVYGAYSSVKSVKVSR